VALSNIDKSDYSFGEDLGEIRETLEFLKHPIGSIFELSKRFNSAKRRRIRDYSKLFPRAKAIANVWLEYRFAFSPLLQTSYNAAEVITIAPQKQIPKFHSAHGRLDQQEKRTELRDNEKGHYVLDMKRTYQGHASVLYRVLNPVHDWKFRLGLRAKDIPTTVWQLLPYSFMIDRLVDISSMCRALINLADPRVLILACSYTYRDDKTDQIWLVGTDTDAQYSTTTLLSNSEKQHSFVYRRTPWFPSVVDTVPSLDWDYVVSSATKIADLVTLSLKNLR
jgi:hypothetical protein